MFYLLDHELGITDFVVNKNKQNELLTTSFDTQFNLYDINKQTLLKSTKLEKGLWTCDHNGSHFICGGSDNRINIFNQDGYVKIKSIDYHKETVKNLINHFILFD